jgi:hypothetical protein
VRVPVRPLDPVPGNRAEPGVRHELMRPGEHADGVELHRAKPAQHRGHAAAAAAGADEALCTQRHQPYVVGGQGYLRFLHGEGGHNYGSLTLARDIPLAPVARPPEPNLGGA